MIKGYESFKKKVVWLIVEGQLRDWVQKVLKKYVLLLMIWEGLLELFFSIMGLEISLDQVKEKVGNVEIEILGRGNFVKV